MAALTLIFGDSNALIFRNLHLQPGCEHWRAEAGNPSEEAPVVAGTEISMTWTSGQPEDERIEVFAFIGATAGGLARKQATRIRQVQREYAAEATRVVFLFGQIDLDFVLWHVLGREQIDVLEFVRARAQDYIRLIRTLDMPREVFYVLEVHPITIADENLVGFFQKYKLDLPRFCGMAAKQLVEACPWLQIKRRAELRRIFAQHVNQLCARHGYEYLDLPRALAENHVVRPEYACSDPFEVHVSLPHVLPLWLDKLTWLRSSRAMTA